MKGSMADILLFPVITLVIFILMLFSAHVSQKMLDQLSTHLDDPAAQTIISNTERALRTYEGMFVFLVFGFFLAALIAATQVPNNPIFLFFSFILYAIGILLSVIIKAIADKIFATNPDFITLIPYAGWLFDNLARIVALFGFLLLILTYSGIKGGGSGEVRL